MAAACTVGAPPEDEGQGHDAGSSPTAGPWDVPGLVDRSGSPVAIPRPASVTGRTLDVTGFGADPAPDGGDDAPAIRSALAAAGDGDEVYLPPGTYDLRSADPSDRSANLVLRSGVDLRGAGRLRTVLRTSFDGEDDSRVIRGAAVHDVIVAGLSITSRHTGPLGEDPDDGGGGGGPKYGIHLSAADGRPSSRVLVEDVAVSRFERHGISVKSSREVVISGNRVADATAVGPGGQGYGIVIEGSAGRRDPDSADDARHNVVIGNRIDGRHLRHAILLQFPTHNNLIADNRIDGSILDAVDLHGEGEYLNEIRDNTVLDGRRAGIALGNSGGAKHQHDASGAGNWIHSNDLAGNRQGILVILGTPDTLIEDNSISAGARSTTGIELRNAPGTIVRGNRITGPAEDFWAIRLRRDRGADGRGAGIPERVLLEANEIHGVDRGVRIDAGRDITLAGNDLDGVHGEDLRVADGADVEVRPGPAPRRDGAEP
ncbi:MAG: right-handed parallel beta-helix repeat-containing protein [Micrococcus sp.]|nr:right-handed parallel beta-helix repeat-containing protein [Micrococcus sp.]